MKHAANDQPDAGILTGVAETGLMTLNGRAHQARRPDAIIDDPMAIRLADAIDYDFDKFGRRGQEMALRSLAFDRCAIQYLTEHPEATLVALAEGLQTNTSSRNGRGRKRSVPRVKVENAIIRAWARDNGYEVSARGRIPLEIVEAYRRGN